MLACPFGEWGPVLLLTFMRGLRALLALASTHVLYMHACWPSMATVHPLSCQWHNQSHSTVHDYNPAVQTMKLTRGGDSEAPGGTQNGGRAKQYRLKGPGGGVQTEGAGQGNSSTYSTRSASGECTQKMQAALEGPPAAALPAQAWWGGGLGWAGDNR